MRKRVVVAFAALAAVFAVQAAPASAALSQTALSNTWQTNGIVFATATYGNTLYLGGKFGKLVSPDGLSSIPARNVAAIDMTTGAPVTGFNPSILKATGDATVRALGVSADGSVLYVGGGFDTVNTTTAVHNMVALNTADGTVNAGFVPPRITGGAVYAILVGPSKIYVGGAFTKAGQGIARAGVAAFSATGAVDPWAPVANDVVRSLALAPDGLTVFIGGHFTQMNLMGRQSVARVDAATGALDAWAIPPGVIDTPQTAWAIIPFGNRVFIGFGKGPNYAAAFRLDNGTSGSQVWRINLVGNVESLAMNADHSRLFLGGHFGTARLQQNVCINKPLHGLLSLNPLTGSVLCDWIPTITPFGKNFKGAETMVATATQLWVGGQIDAINGDPHKGLAGFPL